MSRPPVVPPWVHVIIKGPLGALKGEALTHEERSCLYINTPVVMSYIWMIARLPHVANVSISRMSHELVH